MSLLRHAAKRDTAEPNIVAGLRTAGASVVRLSLAHAPDLLVGYRGKAFLMEVKTGKAQLRPGQELFHHEWRGPPVAVVRTLEEALNVIWEKQP